MAKDCHSIGGIVELQRTRAERSSLTPKRRYKTAALICRMSFHDLTVGALDDPRLDINASGSSHSGSLMRAVASWGTSPMQCSRA
jgi:hypothetical protein